MKAIVLSALLLAGCAADPNAPEAAGVPVAQTTQALRNQPGETIVVHGCPPGEVHYLDETELCYDPLQNLPPPEEDLPSGPSYGGWHGGGGGGGGKPGPKPKPDPGPKPERKECHEGMGEQECLDCCLYNNTVVDAWECNQKRTRQQRKQCWIEANLKLKDCQVETCNRHGIPPILTIDGSP
jgi:hypothetical protein